MGACLVGEIELCTDTLASWQVSRHFATTLLHRISYGHGVRLCWLFVEICATYFMFCRLLRCPRSCRWSQIVKHDGEQVKTVRIALLSCPSRHAIDVESGSDIAKAPPLQNILPRSVVSVPVTLSRQPPRINSRSGCGGCRSVQRYDRTTCQRLR